MKKKIPLGLEDMPQLGTFMVREPRSGSILVASGWNKRGVILPAAAWPNDPSKPILLKRFTYRELMEDGSEMGWSIYGGGIRWYPFWKEVEE